MKVVGRYALFDELARGGMATVHLGRLLGPAGFSRTVAIKRLHPHLAKDPEFVTMLLDEARLAGRIQHPKVVATLDIVASEGELFIVMDYLHGETLARLLRAAKAPTPPAIATAILIDTLQGLHAAHEVKGERGERLGLVHRDFTPQNIMVRRDGAGLVVDFGVAKAQGRYQTTEEGKIKGKLPYMAPEQIRAETVDRRTDVYAAGAVLWETLTGKRLFSADNDGALLQQVLFGKIAPPSAHAKDVPAALDAVVLKALDRDPEKRFATAHDMAVALESALDPARASKVASWLEGLVGEALSAQAARLAELETIDSGAQLTVPRALEEVANASPTKFDVARPGPKLTESEVRRSLAEIDAPAEGASAPRRAARADLDTPTRLELKDKDRPSVRPTVIASTPGAAAPKEPPPPSSHVVAEPTTGIASSAAIVLAPPKPRRAWVPIALVLGAAAAVVAAFLILRSGEKTATGDPPSASDRAAPVGAAPSGTPSTPNAPPSLPTAPPSVASAPVSASPSVGTTGAPPPVAPTVATTPPTFQVPTTPKPATEDCSVPTYIDAEGRKKYKRGCLK